MNYNDYDREAEQQKHLKTKKTLKIFGFIAVIIGGICALTGFADFFLAFVSFGDRMPYLFFLLFIGIPLLGIGGTLLSFGFRKEFMMYGKNEAVPVINQAAHDVTPAVQTIVSAVNEVKKSDEKNFGVNESSTPGTTDENFIVCPDCGHKNSDGARFCSACGKSLESFCPNCKQKVDKSDKFCPNCGKKL